MGKPMMAFVSRRSRPRVAASLVSIALLAACSSGDPEASNSQPIDTVPEFNGDCATLKRVPTFSEAQAGIFSHCVGCHSSSLSGDARHGAAAGVDLDTYDAAKTALPLAIPMVKQHLMPYPKGEGVTNSDRNQLYEWGLCGTPP
jgi:uncharacterized membrane protein